MGERPIGVSQLGYVGVTVSDLDRWEALATGVLGTEVAHRDPDGSLYLRIDSHHHRYVLHPGDDDDVVYVGWVVPDTEMLDRVEQRLRDAGVAVERCDGREAVRRRVAGLIRFEDPEGLTTEVCVGPLVSELPFRPSRPMSGFRAGPLGPGHVFFSAVDVEKAVHFYTTLLGFRVSDIWEADDGSGRSYFLRCNPRHHSLGFAKFDLDRRLGHWSMECRSLDDVGSGLDALYAREIPLSMSLGRHSNDRMVSFYVETPSGFEIEYGWDGLLVDESTWDVALLSETSSWGHARRRSSRSESPGRVAGSGQ